MQVRIIVKGVGDREKAELRAHAQQRLERAMGRFEDRVERVFVWLEDVTGPGKHGVDKLCRITLAFRRGGDMQIRELGDDLRAVFATALDRMRAAMSRQASKTKRGIGAG